MIFEEEKIYPRCSANMIIFDAAGNVLLTKRGVEPYKEYWVIPGGHIKRESPTDAVRREIHEELNVQAEPTRLYGVYENLTNDPRRPTVSIFYIGHIVSGDIEATIEVSETKFFSLHDLPDKIGFNHRRILEDIRKFPEGQPLK
ncbi:MAG TPA: hypothetical protein DCS29_03840 [Candidatus Magasanikbacteria bacterium]|nr:hypothetical protein [Candidatus Magasanikbacteria bacterium]